MQPWRHSSWMMGGISKREFFCTHFWSLFAISAPSFGLNFLRTAESPPIMERFSLAFLIESSPFSKISSGRTAPN